VASGQLRAINAPLLRYQCRFSAIWRRVPPPPRLTQSFVACLVACHADTP
jgi:hypothetical protein